MKKMKPKSQSKAGRKPRVSIEEIFDVVQNYKVFDEDGNVLSSTHPVWEEIVQHPALKNTYAKITIHRYVDKKRQHLQKKIRQNDRKVDVKVSEKKVVSMNTKLINPMIN